MQISFRCKGAGGGWRVEVEVDVQDAEVKGADIEVLGC